jgi:hypothetical protein
MVADVSHVNLAVAVALVLLIAAAPGLPSTVIRLSRRLMVELAVLRMHLGLISLTDQGSLASWPSVQSEVFALIKLERMRRLHALHMEQLHAAPTRPSLARRLLGPRVHAAPKMGKAMAPMAPMASMAPPGLIFKDLVLVGGGHAHAHVLKMFGARPEPGVQLTLVTRDVDTPYSGMLPGYVAGAYSWRECHIDLAKLASFANARLIHAEACGIDSERRQIHLRGRPPIAYDVLSIDIGSAPRPVSMHPGPAPTPTAITPVKPIDGFCKRWDAILERVVALPVGKSARVIVVGGGAGGVELALSMQARLSRELAACGRPPSALEVSLVSRCAEQAAHASMP